MSLLRAGELTRLQGAQEGGMQDTCVIVSRTAGSVDAYGWPTDGYSTGNTYVCGLDEDPWKESMGVTQVGEKLARLRLPLEAFGHVEVDDRVKITKRFGVTLTTQPVYVVVGLERRGPSGLVLGLRLVTDGSA